MTEEGPDSIRFFRLRLVAQDGTLSVMVGAAPELCAAIEPLIRCFATDVTLCGGTGAG